MKSINEIDIFKEIYSDSKKKKDLLLIILSRRELKRV